MFGLFSLVLLLWFQLWDKTRVFALLWFQAWDDVVRKVKPKEEPFEYKKRVVLNQEKSKLSLGEVYEQEYLKQQQVWGQNAN